jgi:hypothetical protein
MFFLILKFLDKQICDNYKNNIYLTNITNNCNKLPPILITNDQFMQIISFCSPGNLCPSFLTHSKEIIPKYYYTILPNKPNLCEPGYICISGNLFLIIIYLGQRISCPIGFHCPSYGLSLPTLCKKTPSKNCFDDKIKIPLENADGTMTGKKIQ